MGEDGLLVAGDIYNDWVVVQTDPDDLDGGEAISGFVVVAVALD